MDTPRTAFDELADALREALEHFYALHPEERPQAQAQTKKAA